MKAHTDQERGGQADVGHVYFQILGLVYQKFLGRCDPGPLGILAYICPKASTAPPPVLLCTALQFVQAVTPMISKDLLVRTAHPLGNVVEQKVGGWMSGHNMTQFPQGNACVFVDTPKPPHNLKVSRLV